jgi:NADH:ubiquinone oxidoreductase subunit 5 (subunit L)/multisubunit Na+/H+ antiporter MnhA subunit
MTVLAFFMALTAAISFPFTGGFMAKEFIFEGLLEHGHYGVFVFLWAAAILNVAIFLKLGAVLLSGRQNKERTDSGVWLVVPVLVLGVVALFGALIFNHHAELLGNVTGEHGEEWIKAVWHLSPVTVASLGIYILGATLFFALRNPEAPAWTTFDFLRTSPVLGRGYELAGQKKFDLYEVALKVINWMANLVFRYFERLIDEVADWFIRVGGAFARYALSGSHNGIYSNYLAWVIAGFALVLALVLLR